MSKNKGFRGWFYFRTGWATYFAFIFAAVNSIIVTYYLAIENLPILKEVFPLFYSLHNTCNFYWNSYSDLLRILVL